MTTAPPKKAPYVEAMIRYRTGRKIVRQLLADYGVVVERVDGRLKVWCARIGDDGEFCDTPNEAFDLVCDHEDVVVEYLRDRDRSTDRWLRVLTAHREDFREPENDQDG